MTHATLIAAHRGGLFLWPENSALAFRESARLPVEQAECDVHSTADSDVVAMHDATLDRTTDAKGPVAARTAAELRGVRVRGTGGEAPPMLSDYLSILAGSPVAPRIEIKTDAARNRYPGLVARTLAVLDASGQRRRSWIIGFNAEDMAEAQAAGGLAGVAWLAEIPTLRDIGVDGLIAVARGLGVAEIGMTVGVLDAPMMRRFRDAGLGVGTWGANHADTIRRALDLGVDILATDDPPLALAMRG